MIPDPILYDNREKPLRFSSYANLSGFILSMHKYGVRG